MGVPKSPIWLVWLFAVSCTEAVLKKSHKIEIEIWSQFTGFLCTSKCNENILEYVQIMVTHANSRILDILKVTLVFIPTF